MAKKHKIKNYPQPVQKKETLGNLLKSTREKLNFTIEDIHAKTRIPYKNISLIEEEKWDLLPAQVYLKGFIKLYAREVGLNYDDIIKLYDPPAPAITPLKKNTTLPPAMATLSSFFDDGKGNKNESESRVSSALVVFILLILATLAISYFASHKENDSSSSSSASEMTNFDVTG